MFSYIILKGKFAIIVIRYKICTAKNIMLSKVVDKTLWSYVKLYSSCWNCSVVYYSTVKLILRKLMSVHWFRMDPDLQSVNIISTPMLLSNETFVTSTTEFPVSSLKVWPWAGFLIFVCSSYIQWPWNGTGTNQSNESYTCDLRACHLQLQLPFSVA